ncbi:flagellar motor switch protein FliN, partial [Pseudomonas carnis]|nr:flagellar motor switch protein FliN [Pseudomonas carnis]
MATEHENTSAEDQALPDERAAALEETGAGGRDVVDAWLAADAATATAGTPLAQ